MFEGWLNENGEACDFSAPVPPLAEDVVLIYTARWHRVYTVYYFSQPTGGAVLTIIHYAAFEGCAALEQLVLPAHAAFLWLRRQVNGENAALFGALLYAFSGFQSLNLIFSHFHDVAAP